MRWIHFFLFGNYFYGICVIALSIEASLQQSFPLNDSLYYLAAFSITVLYYTLAYVSEKAVDESNKRAVWYAANYRLVRITQFILIAFLLFYIVFFLPVLIELVSLSN